MSMPMWAAQEQQRRNMEDQIAGLNRALQHVVAQRDTLLNVIECAKTVVMDDHSDMQDVWNALYVAPALRQEDRPDA